MANTAPAAPPASPRRPGGRPRRIWARLRAALPGPADILLYAAGVAVVRLWLHIALPVAIGAGVVVLVVTVLVSLARPGQPPHAGDGHDDQVSGDD